MKPIDHMPVRGNSTSTTSRKGRRFLRQHGLEDLLGGAVDAADDRHAAENALAITDDHAPHHPGGNGADGGEKDEQYHEPDAGQTEGQIGFRVVLWGDERKYASVDPRHHRPGKVDRDSDRRRHEY